MTMTPASLFRLGLLVALLAAPVSALAQAEQKLPSVTVTGEATISAVPDIAVLHTGAISRAKTAREAMSATAKLMTGILAALKEAGITDADIKTSRLRLSPIREPNKQQVVILSAVEATSTVTVRLRDISKAADVLDKVTDAGANLVNGISFVVSESSKLLDQARTEAVADAKRKAEVYAKAVGASLGRPIAISEGPTGGARTEFFSPRAMPIQPGEEKIGINVTVSYELVR